MNNELIADAVSRFIESRERIINNLLYVKNDNYIDNIYTLKYEVYAVLGFANAYLKLDDNIYAQLFREFDNRIEKKINESII